MIVDLAIAPVEDEFGQRSLRLSEAGGLTQFGAYEETLQPGAVTSHRHWHEAEDEFLLVLEGQATVIDNDGPHVLNPGDAACWPHGDPNAHHLKNLSEAPVRYLVVGSRCSGDVCHYPDRGPDGGWLVRQVGDAWELVDASGAVQRSGPMVDYMLNQPPAWGRPYDPDRPARRYLAQGSVAGESGSGYPGGRGALGTYVATPLSDAGGLTQFGAFTEVLSPGAQSSHRHWHETEDEFLYVLEGTVTVVENDGAHDLGPGDCVCWPRNVPNAHCVQNRTDQPIRYFVAGTRLPEDECHYPDIDLHYYRRAGFSAMTHKDGTPYPGWPQETDR